VLVWDRGRWFPEGDPHQGLKKGRLVFRLEGEKLKGRWYLVRIRGKPNEKRKDWLLIKAHDEWGRTPKGPDILKRSPRSVLSGRSIEEIAERKSGKSARRSNRAKAKA
jgi:bifunctional non-homologous end joining protein LigD